MCCKMAIMINSLNDHWYSTLAEVGVFEVLMSGILKSLLSKQALGKLIESSASFFALAGFHVSVIVEGVLYFISNKFGID